MKTILLITLFVFSFCAKAQKNFDNKILVTVSDTSNLYETVRTAMINADFVVKNEHTRGTLNSFPRYLLKIGYETVMCSINNNVVSISGYYSLTKVNTLGMPTKSGRKDQQRVIYYKGSKTWELMAVIALTIPGHVQYVKEE